MLTNDQFFALPRNLQAVEIAKDVLVQLGTRLRPGYVYLAAENPDWWNAWDKQIQEIVKDRPCEVCALGGLFVAAVDRANACTMGQYREGGSSAFMREYLEPWFNESQLKKIETAYENWDDFEVAGVPRSERMRLIMENIIAGEGRFDGKSYQTAINQLKAAQ